MEHDAPDVLVHPADVTDPKQSTRTVAETVGKEAAPRR